LFLIKKIEFQSNQNIRQQQQSLVIPSSSTKTPFINQDIKNKNIIRPATTITSTNSVFRFNKISQNNIRINNNDQEEGEIFDS